MDTAVRFMLAAIALLATGCAAPMSKVVSTRQGGTIDQQLFKEGDNVSITYQDEDDTLRKTRGTVVHTDGNSVRLRLRGWGEDPVDIEYRRMNTVSHLVKDGWIMGVSTGTFTVDRPFAENFSPAKFRSVGFSPRYALYSNQAIEMNLLVGRGRRVGGWIGTTLNHHMYLIIPRTYWFFGVGLISPLSNGSEPLSALYRLGFGLQNSLSSKLNVRLEVEVGSSYYHRSEGDLLYGFRACFERRPR